jgi:hypothetical protein
VLVGERGKENVGVGNGDEIGLSRIVGVGSGVSTISVYAMDGETTGAKVGVTEDGLHEANNKMGTPHIKFANFILSSIFDKAEEVNCCQVVFIWED